MAHDAIATQPDFFAPVLIGYQEAVLQDEARSNRFIAERLKNISIRCQDLPDRQRREHTVAPG
jgi:hypothetical protein